MLQRGTAFGGGAARPTRHCTWPNSPSNAPLGDEDGPATDPAVAEIVDHFVGGVQGAAGRAEHDFALLGEGDQAGQIRVGANEVPDDRDLPQDELARPAGSVP